LRWSTRPSGRSGGPPVHSPDASRGPHAQSRMENVALVAQGR
jgi:hypothetical protein